MKAFPFTAAVAYAACCPVCSSDATIVWEQPGKTPLTVRCRAGWWSCNIRYIRMRYFAACGMCHRVAVRWCGAAASISSLLVVLELFGWLCDRCDLCDILVRCLCALAAVARSSFKQVLRFAAGQPCCRVCCMLWLCEALQGAEWGARLSWLSEAVVSARYLPSTLARTWITRHFGACVFVVALALPHTLRGCVGVWSPAELGAYCVATRRSAGVPRTRSF